MYQYQPYNYQFQQPPMYQPQPQQMGGMDIMTVQTIQQVEQVQIQPGQRKMVMVQNEPVIASRYADNMGLVTTEYYRLEKFTPGGVAAPGGQEYVTRQEFDRFVASLNGKEGAE